MNHNDQHFHFLNEIFNSDTSERNLVKEQAKFSTLELLPQQRNDISSLLVFRPQVSPMNSKWLETQKKDYLKFYLNEFITRPYLYISWKYWKPDQTLPRMAHYIKTKNMKQCKSYDQRMKQENFDKRGMDITQYVLQEIKKYSESDYQISLMIEQYNKVKVIHSKHMLLLKDNMKKLNQINYRLNNFLECLNSSYY